MARPKKRMAEVEAVRPYVEGVAKNLVDKLYGPAGPRWGTKLTEMEDLLLELREVLTEKMLALALARQAGAAGDESGGADRGCPGCGEPIYCDETQPRLVQTRAGAAQWPEPEGYCRRCRQAFFPSVEEFGDRSERGQSGGVGEDGLRGEGQPLVCRGQPDARAVGGTGGLGQAGGAGDAADR